MKPLSRDELLRLLEAKEGLCASIFMPTHPIRAQAKEDAVRLKNLLKRAQEQALWQGLRHAQAHEMFAESRALLDDSPFWRSEGRGLALFVSEERTRAFRVPLELEELVFVGRRFLARPLLPLLSNGRFHLLALSQKHIRLLEGSRFEVEERKVTGVPLTLEDAMRYDVVEKQLQSHSTARPGGSQGARPAMFHGHGGSAGADPKDAILRFFRQVDAGLKDTLGPGGIPLVLAGVDYLRSIYGDANTYPDLIDEGVSGNPDDSSAAQLWERARLVVEPHFESGKKSAGERFGDLLGTGLASTDAREVLAAARFGRVDTLFVQEEGHLWGASDPNAGVFDTHDAAIPGDEDLLDTAAADTLLHGGRVWTADEDEMPSQEPLAALMRY